MDLTPPFQTKNFRMENGIPIISGTTLQTLPQDLDRHN